MADRQADLQMSEIRKKQSAIFDYLVCPNCYCAYAPVIPVWTPCEECGTPIVHPMIRRSLDQHYALFMQGLSNEIGKERMMH